jgi:hypothetical protein
MLLLYLVARFPWHCGPSPKRLIGLIIEQYLSPFYLTVLKYEMYVIVSS